MIGRLITFDTNINTNTTIISQSTIQILFIIVVPYVIGLYIRFFKGDKENQTSSNPFCPAIPDFIIHTAASKE
ncbi:MAG: hypothetical protein KAJ24_04220, partial [Candidatus Aenigmarchaeota archaeon]|nr:hypothetical protein [Candidatus Aenigmarchaeota archaeon]